MPGQPRSDALSFWNRLQDEHTRYQNAIRALPTDQLRVQDDMKRYLCLRCAGFLEQVTFIVIRGHFESHGYGTVLDFAKSRFKYAPNLNVDAFTRLIGDMGEGHAAAFEEFLTPVRRKSLGDLMGIRNEIAHGKELTGGRLAPERYLTLCEEIYDWLVENFLGTTVEVLDESGKNVIAYEVS